MDITTDTGVKLTDNAAVKIKTLMDAETEQGLALRVAVKPGGCAGFQYDLFFDKDEVEGDAVQDFSGVTVRVDPMSAPYLVGAVIDFVDTLGDSGFKIDNPNAGSGCGCGKSFC